VVWKVLGAAVELSIAALVIWLLLVSSGK